MIPLVFALLAAAPQNESLRRELIALRDADQKDRKGGAPDLGKRDVERARALERIIARHGWPTISLVGSDGSQAAWLIAQHADHDVAFQKKCLEGLARAVAVKEASAVDWAYLLDRVAVNEGRPQVYGTQFERPIADPANVDARRAELGLEPLADYRARARRK